MVEVEVDAVDVPRRPITWRRGRELLLTHALRKSCSDYQLSHPVAAAGHRRRETKTDLRRTLTPAG